MESPSPRPAQEAFDLCRETAATRRRYVNGFRGGLAYGATDDLGFVAVENRVHVHDLHATILHQMGLDHTRLTCRYSGRDFRLTNVHGRVVQDVPV